MWTVALIVALRVLGIALGTFLAVFGVFHCYWEVESWRTLSQLEMRCPVVEGDTRVTVYPYLLMVTGGVTLLIASVFF